MFRRISSHRSSLAARAYNAYRTSSKSFHAPPSQPPSLTRRNLASHRTLHRAIGENQGSSTSIASSFVRQVSSSSNSDRRRRRGEKTDQTKTDIANVEDPFNAPTYNIPEKPVTFVEGASYTFIILAGLGVAAAAGYSVFKELIFEPKEYKVYNKALKRVQDDGQIRVRIGSPITGYGQESRNRAARQRVAHRVWTDEDGAEHVEVNFYIRGAQGHGKVFCEMFKADNEWKYTYLIVEIREPAAAQIILESYIPALNANK